MNASLPSVPSAAPSPLLRGKLAALRRRQFQVRAGASLATMTTLAILLWAAEMLADYRLDLPWGVRLVLLGLFSLVLGWLGYSGLVRPFFHQADDDTLALLAENRLPQFRSRLIASIQLTRPGALPAGASPSLVDALVQETETLARPAEFEAIVPTKPLKTRGGWALVALLSAALGLGWGGQNARVLLRRAFLSQLPVPRKTTVFVVDGDKKVGRGDSVAIEATAHGVVPARGTLLIKSMVRRNQEFIMERATNAPDRFIRTIENVQQSFNYSVQINDGSSRAHRIEVMPRPTVVSMQCQESFPAYTSLPDARRAPGDLVLLAGSTLRFAATASKPLRQAAIRFEGPDRVLPLTINPGRPKELTGQFVIPPTNLTGFTIEMKDRDGMDSRDPVVYHIEVLPDKAPTVRILSPERREELVTQVATLFVEFQAQDDFKVARAWLRYKVGENGNSPTNSIELELAGAEAAQVRRAYPWKMSGNAPAIALGSRIEYWIEVADNNDVTGPGTGSSDHQLARVVTPDEKRADLLTRAGDYLGTIGDVAGDQERLNANLGALILEKKRP